MKKIILFLLSVNFLWAFPPTIPYFDKLLSDNGKITKYTLRASNVQNNMVYFDGEITLTGVLERSDNEDIDIIYSALRFFPDDNIDLPFLFSTYYIEDLDDYKEFERLEFGVLLEDIKVKLPEPLNKRFLGVSAVRAEITISNYHFYGEGEAGREAYGDIVSFKALGNIQTKYFTKNNYNNYLYYTKLEYNSKDNYINIRDNANGKINR